MTKVYFVRHAQPDFGCSDVRSRPLTPAGRADSQKVLEFFKDQRIDAFYCSPYKRSIDTIIDTASWFNMELMIDERFCERVSGPDGNTKELMEKRWADFSFHEDGGESIGQVQVRNIAALFDVLERMPDKSVVIGTHGTALSSILNYFDPHFGFTDFLRIIDWMPYIIELDFEPSGEEGRPWNVVRIVEHLHVLKEWK